MVAFREEVASWLSSIWCFHVFLLLSRVVSRVGVMFGSCSLSSSLL